MCIRDRSKDIGKANREEIKQAMDSVLIRMQGFDLEMCIRDRLNPLCFFLPIVRLSDVLSVGGCSQGQGQLQEVL